MRDISNLSLAVKVRLLLKIYIRQYEVPLAILAGLTWLALLGAKKLTTHFVDLTLGAWGIFLIYALGMVIYKWVNGG